MRNLVTGKIWGWFNRRYNLPPFRSHEKRHTSLKSLFYFNTYDFYQMNKPSLQRTPYLTSLIPANFSSSKCCSTSLMESCSRFDVTKWGSLSPHPPSVLSDSCLKYFRAECSTRLLACGQRLLSLLSGWEFQNFVVIKLSADQFKCQWTILKYISLYLFKDHHKEFQSIKCQVWDIRSLLHDRNFTINKNYSLLYMIDV